MIVSAETIAELTALNRLLQQLHSHILDTERQSNPDFPRAPADTERHDAVEPQRSQQQGEQRQSAEQAAANHVAVQRRRDGA